MTYLLRSRPFAGKWRTRPELCRTFSSALRRSYYRLRLLRCTALKTPNQQNHSLRTGVGLQLVSPAKQSKTVLPLAQKLSADLSPNGAFKVIFRCCYLRQSPLLLTAIPSWKVAEDIAVIIAPAQGGASPLELQWRHASRSTSGKLDPETARRSIERARSRCPPQFDRTWSAWAVTNPCGSKMRTPHGLVDSTWTRFPFESSRKEPFFFTSVSLPELVISQLHYTCINLPTRAHQSLPQYRMNKERFERHHAGR